MKISTRCMVVILLLVVGSMSASTPISQTIQGSAVEEQYKPRHLITLDGTATTITWILHFPIQAVTAATLPTSFKYRIFDGTTGAQIAAGLRPTDRYNTAVTFPAPGTTQTFTWDVQTLSVPNGNYYLQIARGTGDPVDAVVLYQLTVQNQLGTELFQKRVGTIRGAHIHRYIYLDDTQAGNNLVLENSDIPNGGSITLRPALSNINPFNPFELGTAIAGNTAGNQITYDAANLNKGFYLIQFTSTTPTTADFTIVHSSSPYTCPYNTAIFDNHHQTFRHCTGMTFTTQTIGNAGPGNLDYLPRFSLGMRSPKDVINIRLKFFGETTAAPNQFKMVLLDSNFAALARQPIPFNTDLTIPTTTSGEYETIWTVPALSQSPVNYYIEVQMVGTDFLAAERYHLLATLISKGSNTELIDQVEVLRDSVLKYINVNNPGLITLTSDATNTNVKLYSMDATNVFNIAEVMATDTAIDSTNPNAILYYYVQPGKYFASFPYPTASTQITYQQDSYTPCPYDSAGISDPRTIFVSCTGGTGGLAAHTATNPWTYGDSLLQLEDESDVRPRYNLGNRVAGDRVYFTLDFLRPTDDAPSTFILQLLDSTRTPVNPQPANFDIEHNIPPSYKHQFRVDWNVTTPGIYYVDVLSNKTLDPASFVIYELTVQVTSGSSLVGVPSIVSATDIIRNPVANDYLYNLIYLSQTSTIKLWNTFGNDRVAIFSMKASNFLQTNFPVITRSAEGPVNQVPKIYAEYSNLAAGWYGVRFTYPFDGTYGSASFQSSPYQCPFTSGLSDPRCTFDACNNVMAPATDPINLHQQSNIGGHSCNPSTQWWNGTDCNTVDPAKNCNTFDPRSGNCISCNGSVLPTNGACPSSSACETGFSLVGLVCVSDLCASSNADGTCATCKSVVNEVKADGSCGLKTCIVPLILNTATGNCDVPPNSCPKGFFQVGKECYKLPKKCLALTPHISCAKCEDNYKPSTTGNRKGCDRCKGPNPIYPCVTCPDRHYINSAGRCIQVSAECDGYNQGNGKCTSCLSGFVPIRGICCPSGQTVQGDVCITFGGGGIVPAGNNGNNGGGISFLESAYFKHCQIINTTSSRCEGCKPGRVPLVGTDLCV